MMVSFSLKAFSSDSQSVTRSDLAAGQFVVAFGVAAFDGDVNFVAGLGRLIGWKRGKGENAFGLVSDIENDGVGGHGNHGAFAALFSGLALAGMALLILGKRVFEGFDRGRFQRRRFGRRAGRLGIRRVVVGRGWIGRV